MSTTSDSTGTTVLLSRQFVRDAGYGLTNAGNLADDKLDRAMYATLLDFTNRTRCLRTLTTLALTQSDPSLPSLPDDFMPSHLLRAWLVSTDDPPQVLAPELTIISWAALAAKNAARQPTWREQIPGVLSNQVDQPRYLAFETSLGGAAFPTPDADYTLNILWFNAQPAWTFGDAGATVLAYHDHLLMPVLQYGVVDRLQAMDPLAKHTDKYRQLYERHVLDSMDTASQGEGIIELAGRRR